MLAIIKLPTWALKEFEFASPTLAVLKIFEKGSNVFLIFGVLEYRARLYLNCTNWSKDIR